MSTCPTCHQTGRSMSHETLVHMVSEDMATGGDWMLCRSDASCPVAYFRGAETIDIQEIRQIPYHKSVDPDRLVCFCFGHRVSDVKTDVQEHGTSTIRTSIKEACRKGLDECEVKNPQGRCCLGNIGEVIRQVAQEPADAMTGTGDCCPVEEVGYTAATSDSTLSRRSSRFAIAGAIVAAALSSACCWLPLLAIALGTSAAGAGAFFEAWRWPFLAATSILLALGFFLVYRKPRCADGQCETPSPKLRRANLLLLWLGTGFVVALALFPNYISDLTGASGREAQAQPGQTSTEYRVSGMTCQGCVGHTRKAIEGIPGVAAVSVSYADRTARVVWNSEPNDAMVADALDKLGYTSTRISRALAHP